MLHRFSVAGVLAGLLVLALSGFALAQDEQGRLSADLTPLNDSGASGTATINLEGDEVTVRVQADGLLANAPHAQHIHIGGQNTCPDETADENDDGVITTPEGASAYGGVQVSLTTEGAVGADSVLAVDRFPVANDAGEINYERTFALPDGVTMSDIQNGVIVVHGVDLNESGEYDGDQQSPLDESLPLEATVPALCGALEATTMPDTSTAPAQTDSSASWLLAILLIGGAVALGGFAIALRPSVTTRR